MRSASASLDADRGCATVGNIVDRRGRHQACGGSGIIWIRINPPLPLRTNGFRAVLLAVAQLSTVYGRQQLLFIVLPQQNQIFVTQKT
eukprot:scaffold74406_cov18-Prasinocladus_malaysianus.AAC.2